MLVDRGKKYVGALTSRKGAKPLRSTTSAGRTDRQLGPRPTDRQDGQAKQTTQGQTRQVVQPTQTASIPVHSIPVVGSDDSRAQQKACGSFPFIFIFISGDGTHTDIMARRGRTDSHGPPHTRGAPPRARGAAERTKTPLATIFSGCVGQLQWARRGMAWQRGVSTPFPPFSLSFSLAHSPTPGVGASG